MLEWDGLDSEIRESPSLSIFKKKLLLKIKPIRNSVYSIYNTEGISYLAQLRIVLSKRNYHKFIHNFADAVSQRCPANDGIEDTEHFLLLYHSFDDNRRSLLTGANKVFKADGEIVSPNNNLLQILLYGDKNLREEANKQTLDLTIKYIFETKRLDI